MAQASLAAHLRDILVLPFTVTVVVPYVIYDRQDHRIPEVIYFNILGVIIGLAGLALFFYTVFLFKTVAKGTLAPWSEKHELVIQGPYRYCRNPMITGVLFVLIGEALFLHSLAIALWTACFVVINTIYFMLSEEPALQKKFGKDYEEYKKHVSRWIPRLTPYRRDF